MKNKRKKGGVTKGAPSGFIISLLFHVGAFFVAGLFIVFSVVTKAEPEFVAPPVVERPKMNLKKPKVKVQKNSNPKPSSRIVAKVKTKEMPEIQLPDLMGAGTGLMEGTGFGGEFLDLPDVGEMTVFGGGMTSGNDLEVTFYGMRRNADGSKNLRMDHQFFTRIIKDFVEKGWHTGMLQKYYHSPHKLYASTIAIPPVTFAGRTDFLRRRS